MAGIDPEGPTPRRRVYRPKKPPGKFEKHGYTAGERTSGHLSPSDDTFDEILGRGFDSGHDQDLYLSRMLDSVKPAEDYKHYRSMDEQAALLRAARERQMDAEVDRQVRERRRQEAEDTAKGVKPWWMDLPDPFGLEPPDEPGPQHYGVSAAPKPKTPPAQKKTPKPGTPPATKAPPVIPVDKAPPPKPTIVPARKKLPPPVRRTGLSTYAKQVP
jgi:hypothetical protein